MSSRVSKQVDSPRKHRGDNSSVESNHKSNAGEDLISFGSVRPNRPLIIQEEQAVHRAVSKTSQHSRIGSRHRMMVINNNFFDG